MSTTAALILLMGAANACGPAAPARPSSGAEVVQAILEFEVQPVEPSVLMPAGASQPPVAVPVEAQPATDQREADRAAEQCLAGPVLIV